MMLVLSRKVNERIVIGQDISVTVVEVRGDKVRLGIDAPTNVSVHRQEVADAIRRGERRAVVTQPTRSSDDSPSPHS